MHLYVVVVAIAVIPSQTFFSFHSLRHFGIVKKGPDVCLAFQWHAMLPMQYHRESRSHRKNISNVDSRQTDDQQAIFPVKIEGKPVLRSTSRESPGASIKHSFCSQSAPPGIMVLHSTSQTARQLKICTGVMFESTGARDIFDGERRQDDGWKLARPSLMERCIGSGERYNI